MVLSGYQIKVIQQALLIGLDDAHLEMMVRLELDEDISAIAGGNTRTLRIHNLILWADRTGRVKEVVQGAHEYNEGNADLKELIGLVDSWLKPAEVAAPKETPSPALQAISTPPEKPRRSFEPKMVLIPAGYFLMGSDPIKDELAHDVEFPQHSLYLPAYYIGKTPVTNYQYWAFTRGAGYKTPSHWEDGALPRDKADHPVVNVSWDDVIAYCEWLSSATGRAYRLLTEDEWEKAARCIDGRIYPWGDYAPTDKLCNFNQNVGDTTPVGTYPAGANGLFDMAGNVWEWTSSLWDNDSEGSYLGYPYNGEDGREEMKANSRRTLRGGAWVFTGSYVRCAYRDWYYPNFGSYAVGFRVAVESPGF